MKTGDKISVEQFRARPKKMKQSFDGEREIRERLTRLKIAFEEQFCYALPRKFRADFLLRHYRILINYEGGIWAVKSGHTGGRAVNIDCTRLNHAALNGYRMFRFTSDMLKDGSLFEQTILAACGIGEHKNFKHGDGRPGSR